MRFSEKRRKKGLCYDCGRVPVNGGKRCQMCSKKHSQEEEILSRQRRERGLCVDCGEPATIGILCGKHSKYHLDFMKKRNSYRKSNGLCPTCATPSANGSIYCERHRDEHNKRSRIRGRQIRSTRMICGHCKKNRTLPGLTLCQECREYHNDYSQRKTIRRKSEYRCVGCGTYLEPETLSFGFSSCSECRKKARTRMGVGYVNLKRLGLDSLVNTIQTGAR
jgi:hypothetical protein